jgi:hypothetical protein
VKAERAQPLIKTMNAAAVERVGILKLRTWHMVNINARISTSKILRRISQTREGRAKESEAQATSVKQQAERSKQ